MTSDIGRFSTATAHAETEISAGKPPEGEKSPGLVYGSAEEFLHEQLLPTYVRDVDGRAAKWCLEWYYHPEAVSRIEPCDGPGNTSGWMEPRGSVSGLRTMRTTT